MSKVQLVITAVVLEGRGKSARDYEVSRYWVQQLVKRYEAEGPAAFECCHGCRWTSHRLHQ